MTMLSYRENGVDKMQKMLFWGNGSCENHGCEALAVTLSELFKDKKVYMGTLDSSKEEYLKKFDNVELLNYSLRRNANYINRIISKIERTLKHTDNYMKTPVVTELKGKLSEVDVACSIGGDNYCYSEMGWIYSIQDTVKKSGVKSILLGCSIEPSKIDERMKKSLSEYDMIVARETISYKTLKKINKNTFLVPDSAFILKKQKVTLPKKFENVVGINISPLILELNENAKIIYENYKELISYILNKTDMKIALIPHVVFNKEGGDLLPIKKLHEEFNFDERIFAIEEYNCSELKYIISKCRFLITARTHASVAGYSSMVPTLVVGYSNKAIGIARDLFGTEKKYVVNSKDLKEKDELVNSFKWLVKNENKIRKHLEEFIPSYSKKVYELPKIVERVVKNV